MWNCSTAISWLKGGMWVFESKRKRGWSNSSIKQSNIWNYETILVSYFIDCATSNFKLKVVQIKNYFYFCELNGKIIIKLFIILVSIFEWRCLFSIQSCVRIICSCWRLQFVLLGSRWNLYHRSSCALETASLRKGLWSTSRL